MEFISFQCAKIDMISNAINQCTIWWNKFQLFPCFFHCFSQTAVGLVRHQAHVFARAVGGRVVSIHFTQSSIGNMKDRFASTCWSLSIKTSITICLVPSCCKFFQINLDLVHAVLCQEHAQDVQGSIQQRSYRLPPVPPTLTKKQKYRMVKKPAFCNTRQVLHSESLMSHRLGRYSGWILIALPTIVWPSVERSGRHQSRIQNLAPPNDFLGNFRIWEKTMGFGDFFFSNPRLDFGGQSHLSGAAEHLDACKPGSQMAQRLRTCVDSRRSIVQDSGCHLAANIPSIPWWFGESVIHCLFFWSSFRLVQFCWQISIGRGVGGESPISADHGRGVPLILIRFWFVLWFVGSSAGESHESQTNGISAWRFLTAKTQTQNGLFTCASFISIFFQEVHWQNICSTFYMPSIEISILYEL